MKLPWSKIKKNVNTRKELQHANEQSYLRNSEIVIFDKKKISRPPGLVLSFEPTGSETDLFFMLA